MEAYRPFGVPIQHVFSPLKFRDPGIFPIGASESDVKSLFVEDVDADEASPPIVYPSAPEPENRNGIHFYIYASSCVPTLPLSGFSTSIADIL